MVGEQRRWQPSSSGADGLGTQRKGHACTGAVVGKVDTAVRAVRAAARAGRPAAAVTAPRAMPYAVHAF